MMNMRKLHELMNYVYIFVWCDIVSFNNVDVNLVTHDNSYAIKC